MCKMQGVAKVDGEVVAEADMAAMVRDQMSDAGIHPTAIVSPRRRARRRRRRSGRSRSSATAASSATGASSRRARRSSATSRSAPNVNVGIGTVLGGDPQDLKFKGEQTTVEIGEGTRSASTRRSTAAPRSRSRRRSGSTASSCRTCISRTTATSATASSSRTATQLAGHVTIEDRAISRARRRCTSS